MANNSLPQGEGNMAFVLGCGCVAWSRERQHLIKEWCPKHRAKLEEENAKMRVRGIKKQREQLRFSPEQILANLERMDG